MGETSISAKIMSLLTSIIQGTGRAVHENRVRPEGAADRQAVDAAVQMASRQPRQVQFDFGLWTRKIVRELIRREFGIHYTPQNVGKILKMLGFFPQRPVWRAL